MSYWIIKSDPESYSWEQMKKDKQTFWDGVRNYQARNNLRDMKEGDICLFYISNTGRSLLGEVEVIKSGYPDPTTDDNRWLAIDVRLHLEYNKPLSLPEIKANKLLQNIALVKQSRLSVMPLTIEEYKIIRKLVD